MQARILLPISALVTFCVFSALVEWQWIPSGLQLLQQAKENFSGQLYVLLFVVILLESVIYIGFYFPGQLFAVILVVMTHPGWQGYALLTLVMVAAATLGSALNYWLGWRLNKQPSPQVRVTNKQLYLAMLHINSLAFFMFNLGINKQPARFILLAAGLNLPYYLILVLTTSLLSTQVLQLAENNWLMLSAISIWLLVSLLTRGKPTQQV